MSAHRRMRGRLGRALAAVTALVAALPLAHPAWAEPTEPTVPSKIAVETGNKLFLVGHAVGVQIWSCGAVAGGHAWGFVGPRADLFDDSGKLIATHFGGPTWQARDGSLVIGERRDGVTVDPIAIPWLLLAATSTAAGEDGDRLAGTTFIQRVATSGGIAPPGAGCNADTAGTVQEVPYTADYYFWKTSKA